MKSRKSVRTKHIDFIVLDLISIIISFALAYIIRIKPTFESALFIRYRNLGLIILFIYVTKFVYCSIRNFVSILNAGNHFFL